MTTSPALKLTSAPSTVQQLKAKISHLVKLAKLSEDKVLYVTREGIINELEKLSAV